MGLAVGVGERGGASEPGWVWQRCCRPAGWQRQGQLRPHACACMCSANSRPACLLRHLARAAQVPLDGEIVHGRAMVSAEHITGEALPVLRRGGDEVAAGSLNRDGLLVLRALRPAEESTPARIARLTLDAQVGWGGKRALDAGLRRCTAVLQMRRQAWRGDSAAAQRIPTPTPPLRVLRAAGQAPAAAHLAGPVWGAVQQGRDRRGGGAAGGAAGDGRAAAGGGGPGARRRRASGRTL